MKTHLKELAALVLGPHGLQLVGAVHLEQVGGEPGHEGEHLLGAVAGVVAQGGAPHRLQAGALLQQQQGQAQRRGGQQRPGHGGKVEVEEGDLERVLGQGVLEHVHLARLGVPPANN